MRVIEGLECPNCEEKSLIYRKYTAMTVEEVYCFEEMGCGEFRAEYSGPVEGRLLAILEIESND